MNIPNTHSHELLRLYKQERRPKFIRVYHLLLLSSKGYAVKQLTDIFSLSENTVRECIHKYLEHEKVGDEARSGRPGKIDSSIEDELVRLVDENKPRKHGFSLAQWDCKELVTWIANKGVIVSQETIRCVLVRNGFRYVKTGYELARADKEEQEAFAKRFRRSLTARIKQSVILFSDAMNNKLHPKQGYIWTRERKPTVPTHDSHKRVHTTGAVNPLTGKLVTRISHKFNQYEFIEFLRKVLKKIRKPITLFLDGHKSHKTQTVKDFLEQHPRLTLKFLPKYSPKFNPIEHLWNYVRKKRTNNIEFRNQRSLIKTLEHYFSTLPSETIRQVCSLNCILNPG